MNPSKKNALKILLLQIREDEPTEEAEHQQFILQSQLRPSQIHTLNLLKTKVTDINIVSNYDSVWVGGSSDASVLNIERYPGVATCQQMLQVCYDKTIPVFASCFGFQVAVSQFGGEVILDEPNKEIGTFPIVINEAGLSDPLLEGLPKTFFAVVGHKERALTLPSHFINLASSTKCPYHLFKIQDKPFYGFQFHPEMTQADLVERMKRYQSRYLSKDETMADVLARAKEETTHANSLIARFIERVLG